jgi:hypothetical protein
MKDSYYLKHDTNAAHDPKTELMIHRYGMAGYGRYWRLAEILRDQENGKLRKDDLCLDMLSLCWKCNREKVASFLNDLVDCYKLISTDGEYIWSERINRDMACLEYQREQGRIGGLKRWNRAPTTPPIVPLSTPYTNKDNKDRRVNGAQAPPKRGSVAPSGESFLASSESVDLVLSDLVSDLKEKFRKNP